MEPTTDTVQCYECHKDVKATEAREAGHGDVRCPDCHAEYASGYDA